MPYSHRKIVLTIITLLFIIGGVIFGIFIIRSDDESANQETQEVLVEEAIEEATIESVMMSIAGISVEERNIESYTFGAGEENILLVGGIHGGYEWNSVLLAYQFIDYYTANPESIPQNITLTIIPVANPDGLFDVIKKEGRFTIAETLNENTTTGLGRFNANGVDLNRNFACKWQPESSWRGKTVSAGAASFSEPEAQAIKSVVELTQPEVVVFFHSQAGAVYASECENGILPVTRTVMDAYAGAAGYRAVDVFDSYPITGDVEGWLASIGIPAITVELETRDSIEWEKNLAGVEAVLKIFEE